MGVTYDFLNFQNQVEFKPAVQINSAMDNPLIQEQIKLTNNSMSRCYLTPFR